MLGEIPKSLVKPRNLWWNPGILNEIQESSMKSWNFWRNPKIFGEIPQIIDEIFKCLTKTCTFFVADPLEYIEGLETDLHSSSPDLRGRRALWLTACHGGSKISVWFSEATFDVVAPCMHACMLVRDGKELSRLLEAVTVTKRASRELWRWICFLCCQNQDANAPLESRRLEAEEKEHIPHREEIFD